MSSIVRVTFEQIKFFFYQQKDVDQLMTASTLIVLSPNLIASDSQESATAKAGAFILHRIPACLRPTASVQSVDKI